MGTLDNVEVDHTENTDFEMCNTFQDMIQATQVMYVFQFLHYMHHVCLLLSTIMIISEASFFFSTLASSTEIHLVHIVAIIFNTDFAVVADTRYIHTCTWGVGVSTSDLED